MNSNGTLAEMASLRATLPWALRPPCRLQTSADCRQQHGATIGRSFRLDAYGCVCDRCAGRVRTDVGRGIFDRPFRRAPTWRV